MVMDEAEPEGAERETGRRDGAAPGSFGRAIAGCVGSWLSPEVLSDKIKKTPARRRSRAGPAVTRDHIYVAVPG